MARLTLRLALGLASSLLVYGFDAKALVEIWVNSESGVYFRRFWVNSKGCVKIWVNSEGGVDF